MLPKSLTLALLAATAAADRLKPVTPVTPAGADPLQKRQSCGIAQEECGAGCIPLGWTCCPDGLGGCGILETCVLGSNDEYGCCPVGRRCVGEGGVTTIGGGGGGDLPTPTDDDVFPLPTSTGGSSVDDDDDDLDFGGSDDDDDDLDFGDDEDDDFTTPSTTASAEAAPTFAPGGGDDAPSDGDGGDSSATRNALSFVGALAAAVLAL